MNDAYSSRNILCVLFEYVPNIPTNVVHVAFTDHLFVEDCWEGVPC